MLRIGPFAQAQRTTPPGTYSRLQGQADTAYAGEVPTDSPTAAVPRPLKLAAAVVAVEGLVLVVLGIAEAFTLHGDRLVLGLTTAIFFVVWGVGLGFVARGLYRASRWSRGPAVFTQLIQLLVAYSFWGGSTRAVAIPLAVAAVGVLICIFQKASTQALLENQSNDHPVL
jgi:peptidoglycan/LPS O-acetylase OafA/YrhL